MCSVCLFLLTHLALQDKQKITYLIFLYFRNFVDQNKNQKWNEINTRQNIIRCSAIFCNCTDALHPVYYNYCTIYFKISNKFLSNIRTTCSASYFSYLNSTDRTDMFFSYTHKFSNCNGDQTHYFISRSSLTLIGMRQGTFHPLSFLKSDFFS